MSVGPAIFKYGRVQVMYFSRSRGKGNPTEVNWMLAGVTKCLQPNLTPGYGRTRTQREETQTPLKWYFPENTGSVFQVYSLYFCFISSLCIFSCIWKYINGKNKDNSIAKFMKMKFLSWKNFNYIRKYQNHKNVSRWKITEPHNLKKITKQRS